MNISEQRAVLTIAMMAAFADGENSEVERAALRRMAESFGPDSPVNFWEIYQDVVARRRPLDAVIADLASAEARTMAFDMAAGVCEADGTVNEKERAFLEDLRNVLNAGAGPIPPLLPALLQRRRQLRRDPARFHRFSNRLMPPPSTR